MKDEPISLFALTLLAVALFTLTSCSSSSQPPPPVGSARVTYTKGLPGGVLVQTVKVTAILTAIDQAERKATLQGPDGKKFTVKMGREAVHFDQVRVGDQVRATVTQKVAVSLDEKDAYATESATAVVTRSPQGNQPGELAAETIQKTGRIVAIDLEKRTATLRFEDGDTETLPVRADVDLRRRKVGEQVVFRVTGMIAIWVEKSQ